MSVGLAVTGLSFAYRRGERLFDGLTHDFEPGAVTAITGPSGRGKSTLLYILGLMLTPLSGTVTVGDVAASTLPDWGRSAIRSASVGFVFQDAALDPSRTILDCVTEPAVYAGNRRASVADRALELLTDLGVAMRADHKPGQISGGQAQRVAIARALINDPGIVLADEPTGNLDEENSRHVLDVLTSLAREGRTVVIATHDPTVLDRADHVLAL